MKLKKTKSNKLFKILLAVCSLTMTIFLFHACRKIDTATPLQKDLENKFFQTKGIINPAVQKVIDKVKKDNEKYHQVNSLANKEGLAIWDKAIVKTQVKASVKSQQRTTDGDASAEIVIVPLVLEETDYVNSFLAAKITDTVEVKLFSGKDYDEYPFADNLPNTEMTADKLAAEIMVLDRSVFGYTKFEILDNRLFTKDDGTLNATGSFARLSSFTSIDGCEVVPIYWDPDGDDDPCDCSGNETFDHYEWEDCPTGGGGDSFGFGGTGGGDSGGGNGYTGGGSSGTGNNGVRPTPLNDTPPKTPCEVVDSLLKTNSFQQHLKDLRDSTPVHHEKGISFTTPDTSSSTHTNYTGQGILGVSVTPTSPVDGVMHNHYDTSVRLPLYSAEDIANLVYHFQHNEIKDLSTFTFSVVTDSTSYLLMITDSAAFANIANTWFDSERHFGAFARHLYLNHHYGDTTATGAQLTAQENEKHFLEALTAAPFNGAGLRLFRGSPNMSGFSPIKINSEGTVVKDPCK